MYRGRGRGRGRGSFRGSFRGRSRGGKAHTGRPAFDRASPPRADDDALMVSDLMSKFGISSGKDSFQNEMNRTQGRGYPTKKGKFNKAQSKGKGNRTRSAGLGSSRNAQERAPAPRSDFANAKGPIHFVPATELTTNAVARMNQKQTQHIDEFQHHFKETHEREIQAHRELERQREKDEQNKAQAQGPPLTRKQKIREIHAENREKDKMDRLSRNKQLEIAELLVPIDTLREDMPSHVDLITDDVWVPEHQRAHFIDTALDPFAEEMDPEIAADYVKGAGNSFAALAADPFTEHWDGDEESRASDEDGDYLGGDDEESGAPDEDGDHLGGDDDIDVPHDDTEEKILQGRHPDTLDEDVSQDDSSDSSDLDIADIISEDSPEPEDDEDEDEGGLNPADAEWENKLKDATGVLIDPVTGLDLPHPRDARDEERDAWFTTAVMVIRNSGVEAFEGQLRAPLVVTKKGVPRNAASLYEAILGPSLLQAYMDTNVGGSFNKPKKGAVPDFEGEFAEHLREQWLKDKAAKTQRKRERQEERARAQELKQTSQATRDNNVVVSLHADIRAFAVDANRRELNLPPCGKALRVFVHMLSHEYRLKSASTGKGAARYTRLTKKPVSRPKPFNENAITKIVQNALQQADILADNDDGNLIWSRMRSGKVTSRARNGEVVGAKANKIGSDNVGFQLLTRMGWDVGSTMGISSEGGLSDPVAAVIKTNRGGLGT